MDDGYTAFLETRVTAGREGAERTTVYVFGYKHNNNLCNVSCLTLLIERNGREQE